jgi:hypothetical protein
MKKFAILTIVVALVVVGAKLFLGEVGMPTRFGEAADSAE